ncbi:TPA: hypothetical protein ACKP8B_002519 [Serratia marcescens]|nr:hypothetical protein [Serratia marcescens]
MKAIAFSVFGIGMALAASAHAGFNGQHNVQGNQGHANGAGNSQVGQCANGAGQNGGQCIGQGNGAPAPQRPVVEKDRNGALKALCNSAFMQQYAAVCRK